MTVINQVLTFWFGSNFEERRKAWFIKNANFDAEIKVKFESDVKKASTEVYDTLAQTPESALTLMILLDQFPRNIFRGNPKAFATDSKALRIAKQAIAVGLDTDMSTFQKIFLSTV
jgi:uncharacterized protein (DUF924 family)